MVYLVDAGCRMSMQKKKEIGNGRDEVIPVATAAVFMVTKQCRQRD